MPNVSSENQNLILIGASAGGPRVLREIFDGMPKLNAGVVLVQHMPGFIAGLMMKKIGQNSGMRFRLAGQGDVIENGSVYLAPCGVHLELEKNRLVRLVRKDKVNYVCPSVDVAMRSIEPAPCLFPVGVLLTGMGNDGVYGMIHIKNLNGVTIAQNEKTCAIFGMPKEAISTGRIDWVLSPSEIRAKIIELVGTLSVPRFDSELRAQAGGGE
jgi:two-component system, chemotaxis family, protein-glutamate methylesterase/glutaminase